jgi:hypothetical protein
MALLLVVQRWMRDLTGKPGPTFPDRALKPGILARDDASSNRHPAPSILFEQDLFGKPLLTFPDHAPGALSPQKGSPAKRTGQYLTRCAAIYSENAKKQWFVWHLVS